MLINPSQPLKISFFLFVIIISSVIVYWPGLKGGFIFDDFHSIVLNENIHIKEINLESIYRSATSGFNIGLFGRPISMISFGVNHYLDGLNPFFFKLVNLLIHCVNALCIFFIVRLILARGLGLNNCSNRNQILALAITLTWALHPINVTSVLYVVQRMTLLSALFTLFGVLTYCCIRQKTKLNNFMIVVSILILIFFTLCAVLSKENGVLFPLYILTLELFVFSFKYKNLFQRKFVYAFMMLFIALPFSLASIYLAFYVLPDSIFAAYGWRDFTLTERLYTESRILFSYIHWIVTPTIQGMSFFHDNYQISKGLLTPWTTLLAVLSLFIMFITSIYYREKYNIIAFGFIWFLVAHSMESTILPLELVFEHRNYLASLGILISLYVLGTNLFIKHNKAKLGKTIAVVILCFFAMTTLTRASLWSNQFSFLSAEVKYNPNSARAYYELGRWYLNYSDMSKAENKEQVKSYFEKTAEVQTDYIIGLVGLILLYYDDEFSIEKDLWAKEIAKRATFFRLNTTSPKAMASLIQCRVSKPETCFISDQIIESIYTAALSNENVSDEMKAIFISSYSKYFFIVKNEHKIGIDLMTQAILLDPEEAEYKLQMVDLLLYLDKVEGAKAILEHIEKEDSLGRYSPKIAKLKANMTSLERYVKDESINE